MQKFQPLRRDFHAQARHAGEVTSWPAQAGDQSNCDWVGTHLEDNWDSCGRRLCRERCRSASRCDNHSHPTTYQICGQRGQSVVLTFRPAKFDCDISTLDISGFAETLVEGSSHGWRTRQGIRRRDIRSPAPPSVARAPRAAMRPSRRREEYELAPSHPGPHAQDRPSSQLNLLT